MAQINIDVNLHDLTMLVHNKTEFTSIATEPLAVEVSQKYVEVRHAILEELKKHTNPKTMIIK